MAGCFRFRADLAFRQREGIDWQATRAITEAGAPRPANLLAKRHRNQIKSVPESQDADAFIAEQHRKVRSAADRQGVGVRAPPWQQ